MVGTYLVARGVGGCVGGWEGGVDGVIVCFLGILLGEELTACLVEKEPTCSVLLVLRFSTNFSGCVLPVRYVVYIPAGMVTLFDQPDGDMT